jgi:RNA polymerase sigma-70 factor (ECF subfamily)
MTGTPAFNDYDPDAALIRAIAGGDMRALNELYARHGANILSYLSSFLNDRQLAEEVLQDVMMAVWNHAGQFRGDSKVRTWLLTIARNRAINTRRRTTPNLVQFDDALDMDAGDTTPLEKVERKHRSELMREALNRLPPAYQEILLLVFYHQLSGVEIAEVLGISTGTVKSRLHRAKELLRRVLLTMGETSNA